MVNTQHFKLKKIPEDSRFTLETFKLPNVPLETASSTSCNGAGEGSLKRTVTFAFTLPGLSEEEIILMAFQAIENILFLIRNWLDNCVISTH